MQNGTYIRNGDVSYSNKVSDTVASIFSFENLYDSYLECIKGVKWKSTTQDFMFNACFRIAKIHKEIMTGNYKLGKMHFLMLLKGARQET